MSHLIRQIAKAIKQAFYKLSIGRNKNTIHIPFNKENKISNFCTVVLPKSIPELPGMITDSEKKFYYWLVKNHFSGSGDIVEMGPWLGRSTSHLAAGLIDSGFDAKIYCFDKFEWLYNSGWTNKTGIQLKQGDSFLEEFLSNLSKYSEYIIAQKSSIKEIKWHGGQIEILVLDAPKRLSDISKVLSEFGPYLIPNKSMLVWQDFQHAPSFEIPATLSYMGDYITPIYSIEGGCTVAFKLIKQWPLESVSATNLTFLNWKPHIAFEAWGAWAHIIPERQKALFNTGLAMLIHDLGYKTDARKLICDFIKSKDKSVICAWKHYASTSLHKRYRLLFDEISAYM